LSSSAAAIRRRLRTVSRSTWPRSRRDSVEAERPHRVARSQSRRRRRCRIARTALPTRRSSTAAACRSAAYCGLTTRLSRAREGASEGRPPTDPPCFHIRSRQAR
jgi:hypothetical protein